MISPKFKYVMSFLFIILLSVTDICFSESLKSCPPKYPSSQGECSQHNFTFCRSKVQYAICKYQKPFVEGKKCTSLLKADKSTLCKQPKRCSNGKCVKKDLVEVIAFLATSSEGKVELKWETASEIDNAGFHLWRATNEGWKEGDYSTVIRLTDQLIPAEGNKVEGVSYSYRDTNVEPGVTYYYGLEDIDLFGQSTIHWDFIDSAMVE